jgi:ferredoxin
MDQFRYLPNVTTLRYKETACIGCGMCKIVCPHGVFEMNERKAYMADRNGCMECGACALNCPADAIDLTPGVGCASYIIKSWLKGNNAGTCCG